MSPSTTDVRVSAREIGERQHRGLAPVGAVFRHGALLVAVVCRPSGARRSLAPTILKDTGLDARQFAVVNSYFFFAYTLRNPIWGSILDYVGLRVGMLLGGRHLDGRQRVARVDDRVDAGLRCARAPPRIR